MTVTGMVEFWGEEENCINDKECPNNYIMSIMYSN